MPPASCDSGVIVLSRVRNHDSKITALSPPGQAMEHRVSRGADGAAQPRLGGRRVAGACTGRTARFASCAVTVTVCAPPVGRRRCRRRPHRRRSRPGSRRLDVGDEGLRRPAAEARGLVGGDEGTGGFRPEAGPWRCRPPPARRRAAASLNRPGNVEALRCASGERERKSGGRLPPSLGGEPERRPPSTSCPVM